jgi:hypothetical protein
MYDKLTHLARALKEVSYTLDLSSFFISPAVDPVLTSGCGNLLQQSQHGQAWCKNADSDPHASLGIHLRTPSLGGAKQRAQALYSFGWHLVRFVSLDAPLD